MTGVGEVLSPKARLLGAELRALRENADMTVRGLAKLLDVAQATVSRYERGERAAKPEYVARILGTLGVNGARYDEIVEFAITASEPNLITDGSKGLHRHLIELSEFDRAANHVIHVAPLLVPGPMQTRAYAREVMSVLPADERDIRVELRMARREAIDPPREVDVVIAERVLRDGLGGSQVMSEQLRQLAELSLRPNVAIRVLPVGIGSWTIAHDGAFVLYQFPKAAPILHLDHYRGPAFLYDRQDVGAYLEAIDALLDAAMSPEKSIELVSELGNELERVVNHDKDAEPLA